jgi:hypothetical protein
LLIALQKHADVNSCLTCDDLWEVAIYEKTERHKREFSFPETSLYTSSLLKTFLTPVNIGDNALEAKFAKKYPQWRKQYLKNVDFEADKYLQSTKVIESFVQRILFFPIFAANINSCKMKKYCC